MTHYDPDLSLAPSNFASASLEVQANVAQQGAAIAGTWKSWAPELIGETTDINGNPRILNWRYLPYIRPIIQGYISGDIPIYPQNIA